MKASVVSANSLKYRSNYDLSRRKSGNVDLDERQSPRMEEV